MTSLCFHLALPITDLKQTEVFYKQVLGCEIGRTNSNWIDINFFGHQLTFQVLPNAVPNRRYKIKIDTIEAAVRHFGVILAWDAWHVLKQRLEQDKVPFLVSPKTIFLGKVGEQATMFVEDPNGYAIEFKSFADPNNVFSSEQFPLLK